MNRAQRIAADIAYVRSALEDISTDAGDEALNDDQQTRWDAGVAFIETAATDLAAENTRAAQLEAVRAAAAVPAAVIEPNSGLQFTVRHSDAFDLSDVPWGSGPSVLRGRAMTAIEGMERMDDGAKEAATRTLQECEDVNGSLSERFLLTGSEAYRSGFGKLLTGREWALTPDERVAVERAASTTTTAGGFAIPFNLDPTIILSNTGMQSGIRSVSRVVRGTSNKWNGISTAGVTASWDGEAAEVSDDAPTLAQPSITAYKAQAFVPFSIEIGQDWPGMEGDITALLMDAKDRLEATALATGSGTNQPVGIVTALVASSPTVITASITGDTFALTDVYALFEALGPRSRSKATWAANLTILNKIRQFATANNYNGFTVDLTAAGIPAVLGRPLVECSDMDGTYGSGENYVLTVGDFNDYVIYDRIGMSVELIPHLFHTSNNLPSGQRGFYASWRTGADSVNDNAFRILNVT